VAHDVWTIRLAGAGDAAALSGLARRTWWDAFGSSVESREAAVELEATRSEAYFRRAFTEQTILVAEHGGALIGYAQVGEVDILEVEAGPGDRALRRIYVETAWQGCGVGRSLLEAALRDRLLAAATRVFLQAWERNERAIRLYESVGFRTVGTTRFTIGSEAAAEDLVMVLERPGAGRPR
jgi:ribosomal protein S18 acetylase RimI-like enzyme